MKFKELPTFDRKGRTLEPVENGTIESVSISNEDHGCLTAWLFVKFRGGGCGFGGYKLGNADGGNLSQKGSAAEWIVRCIRTLTDSGYGKWEDLQGVPIRVIHEGLGGEIVAVGHYIEDKWFCPRVEFKDQ